ncbi:sulfite exporter TauE/SafE family protein [Actinocrinis puniceicyclus]|uniref:Probable membrane transporter protein n=1 Tax=Actinocrinis puniceicyclus TaxID=977794 RepID=A0A8J8BG31_9ACTN|nr:sulfite exporter TauE/SafE family protein [Actinocrinis puniceicyclus]MBS2965334.1 sulfite exporter TauE/SafE family protein [Actinocrinis puniceicyclus]
MSALILALPAGLAVGASLGALGAGGSILTVPVLVYLLGRSAHQATTMSLVIVGATALAGALAHARAGRVRLGPGLAFGALGAAGSVLGSKLGARIDPNVLLLAFAVLMLGAATAMLVRSRRTGARAAPDAAGPPAGATATAGAPAARRRVTVSTVVKIVAAASVVGLLTGFFGVGGGFVVVPVLVLVFGYDTASAIGTSLVVIAVNSAVALGTRLAAHVQLPAGALLALFLAAAITGALLGRRYAARLDPRLLGIGFSVALVILALYMSARSLTALG